MPGDVHGHSETSPKISFFLPQREPENLFSGPPGPATGRTPRFQDFPRNEKNRRRVAGVSLGVVKIL
jgi:hypothetical protein